MQEKKARKLLQEVQETYDAISKEFSDTRAFAGKEFDPIQPYLQPGQTWVDLGCGNGRLLQFLEKEASGWHQGGFYYIGIDNSRNLLAEAREKHPTHDFKFGDLAKIPLKDHSADITFCIRAFHHLPSEKLRLKALKEMKRILKPQGILLLTVWNLWQKKYWLQHLKAWLRSIISLGNFSPNDTYIPWGKSKKQRYYHAFTLKELEQLAKKAGFTIIELNKTLPETKTHDYLLIAHA